mgnify:CR=1 FL=1
MRYSIVIIEKNYRVVTVEADSAEDAMEKFQEQDPDRLDDLFDEGIELQSEYEYAEGTLGPAEEGE